MEVVLSKTEEANIIKVCINELTTDKMSMGGMRNNPIQAAFRNTLRTKVQEIMESILDEPEFVELIRKYGRERALDELTP